LKSNRGEAFETDENFSLSNSQERRVPTFSMKSGAQLERITAAVQNVDPGTGRVVMIAPDVGLREFSFDGVFPEKASQKTLYDTVARRLVGDFVNGYNATAIVYGQTGAGKTYSMFGKDEFDIFSGEESMQGIVPRACEEILTAMENRRDSFGIESSIGVSYVEVFGDQVSDLLKHGARCGQSKVASQRYVLLGAAEQPINNMAEVSEILRIGANQKRRAATAMNDKSSRAHSLFILTLQQRCVSTNVQRTSRLFLADLGGSEQVKKSKVGGAVDKKIGEEETSTGFEMGDRMREAVYINLGLLALKKCIEALNNRALYTPYKDSKLTMLLSSGLGGDSKTSFIVCGSMDPIHASETVASLRFGEKCAMIEMEVSIYTCLSIYVYMCIHIKKRMHIQMYSNMYIYTYIHVYIGSE
jgi:kinesin family protein 5